MNRNVLEILRILWFLRPLTLSLTLSLTLPLSLGGRGNTAARSATVVPDNRGSFRGFLPLSTAVVVLVVILCSPVRAEEGRPDTSIFGRITVMEENDKLVSHDDRHYTQGVRFSYLSGSVTPNGGWDRPYAWLSDLFPIFQGPSRKRTYEGTVGQSIFTPTNTERVFPSKKDRPYAAWLYTGASLLQETDQGRYRTLENVEVLVGVVGPAAFGGVTQNDFHQFVGVESSLGWKTQIHDEPGFVATYERKWRFQQTLIGNLAVDAIPELGASVGNVLTYGEVGGLLRFGQNLGADYGPDRIRPSLSGTAWFDADQLNGNLGWYVFLGTQGRVVGRNLFLDGNTFATSPSVNKKTLVADFMGGVSLFWSTALRLDLTVTQRTKEFYGQRGHPDRFGGMNLAFQF